MDNKLFPAHIRIFGKNDKRIESCEEHAKKTAEYASYSLKAVGLGNAGYFAGMIHDGKMTEDFSQYITAAVNGEKVVKGLVKHTFAPVKLLLTKYHGDVCETYEDLASEILAYAVGAHHGLFDCINAESRGGFYHRITADTDTSDEAIHNFYRYCLTEEETTKLFQMASDELTDKIKKLDGISESDEETAFYLGMLARLVLSGVIEGDRRDTAEFMQDAKFANEPEDMSSFWNSLLAHLEEYLFQKKAETPIGCARREISKRCKSAASLPVGVYRLNVPTGGGKTLSALRFAIAHAKEHNKKRIIYTVPLLSILEQNASVIREALGTDAVILEHHSNVIHEADTDETDEYSLLVENYSCPIIITTMVQLLNTLFDGKTSCIRRFHALGDAVILIDEVQTIPLKMLTLFNLAVNFLSEICRTTVILCSATQPCFEETKYTLRVAGDIIPYDQKLWEVFKRTDIRYADKYLLSEIPAFVSNLRKEYDSILVVCNTKDEAVKIYEDIKELSTGRCFHLSAAMCTEHRRKVIHELTRETAEIAEKSKAGIRISDAEKLICVSTQVIEAGVDISFGCVVRLLAGLDNIIQSAGRGNRNGESDAPVPVYIVQCEDEKLTKLPEIYNAKNAAFELLNAYEKNPKAFCGDLSSKESIGFYYRSLFKIYPQSYMEMKPMQDKPSLFSMLSDNESYRMGNAEVQKEWEPYCLCQAFAEAGKLFTVFDTETEDVVVPYGKGADVITKLCSEEAIRNISFRKSLLDEAKNYSVSLFPYQTQALGDRLEWICDGHVRVLKIGCYDDEVGLSIQKIKNQEVNSSCSTATLLNL